MRGMIALIGLLLCPLLADAGTITDLFSASHSVRARNRVTVALPCSELTAAAQDHADFLAGRRYSAYARNQPNGHYGLGNGMPQERAARHGFAGTLLMPKGNGISIIGEILAVGQRTAAEAIECWRTSSAGHGEVLLGGFYNVCGFGHSVNESTGEQIWVGLYGRESVASAAPSGGMGDNAPKVGPATTVLSEPEQPPAHADKPAAASPACAACGVNVVGAKPRTVRRWVGAPVRFFNFHPVRRLFGRCR